MFYADVTILRETVIGCTGHFLEFGAEVLHELFPVDWNAGLFRVAANFPAVIRPGDQPLVVIPEFVPGGNAQITRLKFIGNDRYDAQLEESPVNIVRGRGPAFEASNQRPPGVRHEE